MPAAFDPEVEPPPRELDSAAEIELADVALDLPGHDPFTYSVPPALSVVVGDGVQVQFRNRTLRGFVCARRRGPHPAFALKPIQGLIGLHLPAALLRLVQWGAKYYRCSVGEFLSAAVPAPVRAGVEPQPERTITVSTDFSGKLTAAQHTWLSALPTDATLTWDEAVTRLDGKSARLRTLSERGAIVIRATTTVEEIRMEVPAERYALSAEQQTALNAILASDSSQPWLLFGVTGSGKTLVYLELAERTVASGKQVLWLLPEIGLTPQAAARVRARFPRTIVWHSGFTDGERTVHWRAAAAGEADVVVGTRSALFAPLPAIGLIIVDEEHEASYKQEGVPRYHARDLAVVYGQDLGAHVVLGSATPALETICNVRGADGRPPRYRLATLRQRPAGGTLPACEVVDMRVECQIQKRRAIISGRLRACLTQAKARGEQSIVLLNRRGWSPVMSCTACGTAIECPSCAITLTLHKGAGNLRCHYCGHQRAIPTHCPACREPAMSASGIGTEQLEQILAAEVPGLSVLRVDADTVSGRQGHARLFSAFAGGTIDCLLGTQMVAKGLDFPRVTVVGVLEADRGLSIPEFRAAERTWQLIAQVSGRAGRGKQPGTVIVQAFDPNALPLRAALEHRPKLFVDEELALRREHQYPPFGAMVRLLWSGRDLDRVSAAARSDAEQIAAACREFTGNFLGPNPAALERLKDAHRWSGLIKAPSRSAAQRILDLALPHLKTHAGVHRAVDVDPLSTT